MRLRRSTRRPAARRDEILAAQEEIEALRLDIEALKAVNEEIIVTAFLASEDLL